MNKIKILSIAQRAELVKRLESGDDIATLAHDFKRGPQTIRKIRQRIEKEGSGWYLKPAKKGRKPGGNNPNAGRFPQRKILSGEKKKIRAQLESNQTGKRRGRRRNSG